MKKIVARIWRDIQDFWIAAIAIAGYIALMNLIFHAFCPMIILTGFPCPGCGMTRAMFYLISGKIQQSIQMNPMGIPIAALFIYFFWNRYIMGRKAKGMKLLTGIAFVLLIVIYIWRMYLFFPDRVPYIYTESNILAKLFPGLYPEILAKIFSGCAFFRNRIIFNQLFFHLFLETNTTRAKIIMIE